MGRVSFVAVVLSLIPSSYLPFVLPFPLDPFLHSHLLHYELRTQRIIEVIHRFLLFYRFSNFPAQHLPLYLFYSCLFKYDDWLIIILFYMFCILWNFHPSISTKPCLFSIFVCLFSLFSFMTTEYGAYVGVILTLFSSYISLSTFDRFFCLPILSSLIALRYRPPTKNRRFPWITVLL